MFVILLLVSTALCEFRVPFTQTAKHLEILKEGFKKYAPKIYLSACDKGYCMMALEDISNGEEMFNVPASAVLSKLTTTPLTRLTSESDEDFRLLLNILYYKYIDKSDSIVSATVHSFPVEFDVPLNWTESDIDLYNTITIYNLPIREPDKSIPFCHHELDWNSAFFR